MDIILDQTVVERCWKFAEQAALNQRPNSFGSDAAQERSVEKIVADTFIGKLGEAAVQKWLGERGIHIELDWSIKPRGEWDTADICYNNWLIDVKCTKLGHFFLIEWNKLQFRADAGELPHFFIMTKIREGEAVLSTGMIQDCAVELTGFIDTRQLNESNSDILTLKRGDKIPGTESSLLTSNFAMNMCDMNQDWKALSTMLVNEKPFSLEDYTPPGNSTDFEKNVIGDEAKLPMKYSLLAVGSDAEKYDKNAIRNFIKKGIKCLLFVYENKIPEYDCIAKEFDRSFFQLYGVKDDNLPALTVYDGKRNGLQQRDFESLCQLPMTKIFNYEQYDIEHFNITDMLIVKAAAGTGKTTVMIDRIMFLLAVVEGLHPADIAMITFTNKATASMIGKLQKRVMDMFRLTGMQRWYEVMEELSQMQISTIDSFFNTILKNDGSVLGYGVNSAIKSFIYERKNIIREIVNDLFKENQVEDFLSTNILPVHEYISRAFYMWEKLHSRGYFEQSIYEMDFGKTDGGDSDIINTNLSKIIKEAEKRYQLFKKKYNAYTINDIKADMHAMVNFDKPDMRQGKLKFLFIDEFQDTDNSQISSVAWLQKQMGCQLFVVGDVKQSIYRFRGAEESAFDELKKCLQSHGISHNNICEKILRKNYRTAAGMMNSMNSVFAQWGESGLLVWDGKVQPCIENKGVLQKIVCKWNNSSVIPVIKTWMPKTKHICLLTRSNNQVENIASMCRQEGIPCRARLSGGFYKCGAVRDMYALLGAMLYPADTRRLYNLLLTPYTTMVPDGDKIGSIMGDEIELRTYLDSLLAKDGWHEIMRKQRIEPFFPLLVDILDKLCPVERYSFMRKNDFPLYVVTNEADYDANFYQLNLNKLLRILYENFAGEYASLLTVFDFLENKIQTDRTENCVYPDTELGEGKCIVEAMTVHKAKGLEFETVILPYMNLSFYQGEDYDKFSSFITEERSGKLEIGWAFKYMDNLYQNEYYVSKGDDEQQAICREESRILYVAMTRAAKNLICLITSNNDPDTWEYYIKNCQEVR